MCRWIVVFAACALLAGTGCSGQKELVQQQATTIDSLKTENLKLRARSGAYGDSLQYYSDIETGRVDRTFRILRSRLDRMQYDISVLREGGRTVATLGADVLFQPATDTLTDGGRVRLDTLAAQLRRTYPERALRVEGHSDNQPLSPQLQQRYSSNWNLSAARAAAVIRYLTETQGLAAHRFALVALGDTQPVASNTTAAGRRQNRRVRITVLPAPRDYDRPFDAASF